MECNNRYWVRIRDGNEAAFELFSRHYTFRKWRQRDGKNAKRFIGPGERIVLLTRCRKALFVWLHEKWRMDKQIGICCTVFRNESDILSSKLIKEAMLWAAEKWPRERLFTFVNGTKIKSHNPGYCFKKAGWRHCGYTQAKGLHILEYLPNIDDEKKIRKFKRRPLQLKLDICE